ncbi:MAG: cell division protein FtsK [Nocardioidaceae bacterium]
MNPHDHNRDRDGDPEPIDPANDTEGAGELLDLDRARSRRSGEHLALPAPRDPADDVAGPGSEQADPGEGEGEALEGEIVDPAADAGPATPRWRAPDARRPVVPAWAKSRAEAKAAGRWAAGYTGHVAAFHTIRTPAYAAKLAGRAPRGLGRTVVTSARWVFDAEGAPVRADAVRRADSAEYLRLVRLRNDRVRLRAILAGAAALAATIGILIACASGPGWTGWLLLAAALAGLGLLGGSADRPLVGQARTSSSSRPQRLTSDIVIRALSSLGVGEINKAMARGGSGISFPAPISRDGPGWRAEVDLPYGVTVAEIVERRIRLASGLRRPPGCVWPEPVDDEHAGRLVLWVGDTDMSKARQPAWPMAKTGNVDLFAPFAFGTDQRGRWVQLTLMYVSVVIGALPRMGKTFALRLLLLAAALDPRAELHAYDLKGTGDLSPLEPVAHRYRPGDETDDLDYALADMRGLQEEMRRRTRVVRDLPRDICPENQVTPELAGRKRLRLHPIVVGVDECQVWFEHPVHGGEFEEICTDLVKRGPALGIVLMLATQRPDAKSLPTGISANVSVRFCLKVMGQTENDMVLGTSMYKNGVRATQFARKDKGIGYLVGEGEDAKIVRGVYLDAAAADKIVARARVAREAAGTLSGHALGDDHDEVKAPSYSLLDDILAVCPTDDGTGKFWSETVVDRLTDLRPDAYHGWTAEQLGAALKPYGIRTSQVWGRDEHGAGANRRGISRDDITAVVAERDRKRGA